MITTSTATSTSITQKRSMRNQVLNEQPGPSKKLKFSVSALPSASRAATRVTAPTIVPATVPVPTDTLSIANAPTDLVQLITESLANTNRRLDELIAQNEALYEEIAVVRKTVTVTVAMLNRIQTAICPDLDESSESADKRLDHTAACFARYHMVP
uniref:Uncharacterized protein n=1 Tax=Anopheles merus TaxID=30066 RepID=A0A182VN01_ANOME